MPIRGLLEFLVNHRLVKSSPESAARGWKVAVDAGHWLQDLEVTDPLTAAAGGPPGGLEEAVNQALRKMKAAGLDPLFVFDGLHISQGQRYFGNPKRMQDRRVGWEYNNSGMSEKVKEQFRESSKRYQKNGYVDVVFGGPEHMLYGASKLIVSMDHEEGKFQWIDVNQVLGQMRVGAEQLLDMCVLAGFEFCPTFPPLNNKAFSFERCVQLVQQYQGGYRACVVFAQDPSMHRVPNYVSTFMRAQVVVRHHLVMLANGVVAPLNNSSAPPSLENVMGSKLPNTVYFFLSQSAVSAKVLDTMLGGVLLEMIPMCDSGQYRLLLNSLMAMRGKTMGLLASCLHAKFSKSRIVTVRWYDPKREYAIKHSPVAVNDVPNTLRLLSDGQLKGDLEDTSDGVLVVLRKLGELGPPEEGDKSKEDCFQTEDEVYAKVVGEFLRYQGYTNSHGTGLSVFGEALLHQEPEEASSSDIDSSLLMMEMLRSGFLNGRRMELVFEDANLTLSEDESNIALLGRLFTSLPPASCDTLPWAGLIDKDLKGFQVMAKEMLACSRNLLDVIHLLLWSLKRVEAPVRVISGVATRLPFQYAQSTAVGVLMKKLLSDASYTKEQAQKDFPNLGDIQLEVERATKYWSRFREKVFFLEKHCKQPSKGLEQGFKDFRKAEQFFEKVKKAHKVGSKCWFQ